MEGVAGVLEASVTVEEWVRVRICRNGQIKGVKYERFVIPVSNHIGNNASVAQIQNRAQIQLVFFFSAIPLELRYVGQPFLVRLFCIEVTCKNVLCQILRAFCTAGAAVVGIFHCGINVLGTANSQNSLVIDRGVVVSLQIVPDTPVSLIWMLLVNLFHQLANPLVFNLAGAGLLSQPLVVCRARDVQDTA